LAPGAGCNMANPAPVAGCFIFMVNAFPAGVLVTPIMKGRIARKSRDFAKKRG
jgi:hypothetical protein